MLQNKSESFEKYYDIVGNDNNAFKIDEIYLPDIKLDVDEK